MVRRCRSPDLYQPGRGVSGGTHAVDLEASRSSDAEHRRHVTRSAITDIAADFAATCADGARCIHQEEETGIMARSGKDQPGMVLEEPVGGAPSQASIGSTALVVG